MEHERLVHNQMFDALKSHDRTASYAGDGWVRRLGAMSVVQLLADACRQECPISLFPRGESILRTWAFKFGCPRYFFSPNDLPFHLNGGSAL